MHLTDELLVAYEHDGYVLIPACFSREEVQQLSAALPAALGENSPRRVLEKDGRTVRSVYGSHLTHRIFQQLVRDERLLAPSERLVGGRVYVHQFKINAKQRFGGDAWAWHQDYTFWRNEDGLPAPLLTTGVLFLDEVTEFNGPLILVPGSHQAGCLPTEALRSKPEGYENSPDWVANLTAQIKYALSPEVAARVIGERMLVAPKGPAGSLLFFHPNMVHASAPNCSPFDRVLVLVTDNNVANIPVPGDERRPEFLCSRDYTPLQART